MLTLLRLGFLLGLRHAFEPDHAAAIAALASRSTSVRDTVRQGVAWGIGHRLTLLVFCSAVYSLEIAVPLRRSAHCMKWAHDGLQVVIAGISIMVGANMIHVEGTSFLG